MNHVHMRRSAAGLSLVAESVPGAASVHLGAWLRSGARHETPDVNGISHFLEHIVFKGNGERDCHALARAIEALGGQFDAYTTHELTCYTLQVLPRRLAEGWALLAELVGGAGIDAHAVDTEKQVVIEEIEEAQANPSDVLQELCAAHAWEGHPLALPVLGTREVVESFDAELLRQRMRSYYTADRLLLAAAGAVDGDADLQDAEQAFAALPRQGSPDVEQRPVFHPGVVSRRHQQGIVEVCLCVNGFSAVDKDRYALWLLDALLGSTMSSRLFQEVRERRGLAYSIGTSMDQHRDAGIYSIEAVSGPRQVSELLRVVRAEIERLLAEEVSETDMAWLKEFSTASLELSSEQLSTRLGRVARSVFFDEPPQPLPEALAQVEALTAADLKRVAERLFGDGRWLLGVIGPVTERRVAAWWKVLER